MKISREFKFDAAHFLINYKGKCAQLHGHTYKLKITLCGEVNPDTNMLVDFGILKSFFEQNIEPIFDHKTLVPSIESENFMFSIRTKEISKEKECNIVVNTISTTNRYILPMSDVSLIPIQNTTVEELASYIKNLTTIYFKLPCTIEMWEGGAGSVKI